MAELTRTTQEAVGETHEEQLVHAEMMLLLAEGKE